MLGLMIHLTSSVHCIFSRGHAKLKLLVSHTFSLPSLVRTTFLDQLYSINTEHIRRSLISPPTNAKRVAKTHDCACPLESQTRTSKGIAAETKNGLKDCVHLDAAGNVSRIDAIKDRPALETFVRSFANGMTYLGNGTWGGNRGNPDDDRQVSLHMVPHSD